MDNLFTDRIEHALGGFEAYLDSFWGLVTIGFTFDVYCFGGPEVLST